MDKRNFMGSNKKQFDLKKSEKLILSDEVVMSKIFVIRGEKVMIDKDIAELYGVETKVLKQAVKRNIDIFPQHFMFELTEKEFANLRSQIVTSSWGGQRYLPYVFTEHGILQLASVLKSERAKKMSIRIIEVFVKMRKILETNGVILSKLHELEAKGVEHDDKLLIIFGYLEQLEEGKKQETDQKNRKSIGYKI
ncbi:MAG: ORF6N domain-containing protein [Bacteroidales bacterium]|nr:ORF6N domain-containing protein [Bacteroidales bacterium]